MEYREIEKAWYMLVEKGGSERVTTATSSLILDSWKRCLGLGMRSNDFRMLQHTSAAGFQLVFQRHRPWIDVAIPLIEDVRDHLRSIDHAMLLLDEHGCVVLIDGVQGMLSFLEQAQLDQGAMWTEESVGTTAVGLALKTMMPVQTSGFEHFHAFMHGSSIAVAPIFDPATRMVGLFAIVTQIESSDPRDLALTVSVAQTISNSLQSGQFLEDANRHLSRSNAILETIPDGVLIWDQYGRINHCNSSVSSLLGMPLSSILGKSVNDLIDWQPAIREILTRGEAVDNLETVLNVADRRVPCVISLKPISANDKSTGGWVAICQPLNQLRKLVQQQAGNRALSTLSDFETRSAEMRKVLRLAKNAAKSVFPILLVGEQGVGKKRLAQAIHNESIRALKPFVVVNCRALTHESMVTEILGIEGNSLDPGRPSKFELADGGTLVLEAIEDLPLAIQEAIANLIDNRYFMRVRGSRMVPVNVRLIVSTSVDLARRVAEKSFSDALYYRLTTFRFEIPALRSRAEDIPMLVTTYLKRKQSGQLTLSDSALDILKRYPWPGNVRQLEDVLERAVAQAASGSVNAADLPELVRNGRLLLPHSADALPTISIHDAEREAIMRAGWACRGVASRMSEELGIGRTTLWRKLKEHNIDLDQYKVTNTS